MTILGNDPESNKIRDELKAKLLARRILKGTNMRPTRDETWLNVATEIARRSTCLRRSVGCVLVDVRGNEIGNGYNGRASGLMHCNEPSAALPLTGERFVAKDGSLYCFPHACTGARAPSGTNLDGCEAIHAEQNALIKCRDIYAIDTCYVTTSPCLTCVKLLLNTSCLRIVFREPYAHDEAARKLWLPRSVSDPDRQWIHFQPKEQ